jgi:DNA-binding beta-propeller fold protein YncE
VDTRGGAVLTYVTRPRFGLVARFPLPGTPYGIAIDSQRGRLWLTLTAKDELVELSTAGAALRLLGVYATGRQPNTVAVDSRSGRVFVADAAPGTVQLIDPRN